MNKREELIKVCEVLIEKNNKIDAALLAIEKKYEKRQTIQQPNR